MNLKTMHLEVPEGRIAFEIGRYCEQANACVTVQKGDTLVMCAATMGGIRGGADFLPLSVEYEERLYGAGLIKSSRYVKREGRPTDNQILTARLIDRSIRPLFPKTLRNEVQIVVTVLSYEPGCEPELLSMLASFAALMISDIPWAGPIGCAQIGLDMDGARLGFSQYGLYVCGTSDAIIMLEGMLPELSNRRTKDLIESAASVLDEQCRLLTETRKKWGKEKAAIGHEDDDIDLDDVTVESIHRAVARFVEASRSGEADRHDFDRIVTDAIAPLCEDKDSALAVHAAINREYMRQVRELAVHKNARVDGRELHDIRPIAMDVAPIPRAHGSSMFKRGETQVLNAITLGAPADRQRIEGIRGEAECRFFHHYIAPPHSVGETGRVGSPGRREIGHGMLAQRALTYVLPNTEEFPYTIRAVSEVLSQNGSSSMASTCATTLSLLDAGVPIARPVAGISIGMMSDTSSGKYRLLTDIAGIEDFGGDMDFKVAGTEQGVTAIQMDTKTHGIPLKVAQEAIDRASAARAEILSLMHEVAGAPRVELSQFAPRIEQMTIPVESIGKIVGSGGKTIRKLSDEHDAKIEILDDGTVWLSAHDKQDMMNLRGTIHSMVSGPETGKHYSGNVARVMEYGVFVEILPGTDGLIHVSRLGLRRGARPNDEFHVGQRVEVVVTEVDSRGRVDLRLHNETTAAEFSATIPASGSTP